MHASQGYPPGHGVQDSSDTRNDGLRRLSGLTVTAAVAAAAATGVVAVAAYHASNHATSAVPGLSEDSGIGDTDAGRLQGPDQAPLPGRHAPVGVSSGS